MTYFEKEKIENKVQIWADGACSQQHGSVGGWGALIFEKNKEHQIYGGESLTTNNKMEMLACIKALDYLCRSHLINWQWVRGHSGNRGNEIADGLAVRGKEEQKEKIRQSISARANG